ncbi:Bestrophin, RFP-TM, chloride channel-domain-containing protein [Desarmillaria tabescens]|uniref:Bestrophin, RFP-TM, chloride channel-domain-containing protein n=1 Tax=Armillaria tabescens TaxID=1929756 RepID=A0AA39NEW2_ARMTA|nr:Bestrophin, RFP-TM, chloride channel-domain-containing protein [Desarmillaria tabescens]KAK0464346.1 Bestrophin, RFP-TM, chloride channel-domain-containing protein [Desarmillaria tabescens]
MSAVLFISALVRHLRLSASTTTFYFLPLSFSLSRVNLFKMANTDRGPAKRSLTGKHTLLPAVKPNGASFTDYTRDELAYSIVAWTFGRGSVIWRIWPAVLLHTLFAAVVVYLQLKDYLVLSIPNIMLTVLGVVIGFVISYRAMSGYDRYWMGRTCWSDVIKYARTMGRLVWFHVPPRLAPKTPQEIESGRTNRSPEEMIKVMTEKRMALDLVEAFAVATKHHIRGELGIYYDDLYDLVLPLHDREHPAEQKAAAMTTALLVPSRVHRIASNPSLPHAQLSPPISSSSRPNLDTQEPVIPPVNAYGTFHPSKQASSISLRHQLKRNASSSSVHRTLQPSQQTSGDNVMDRVSGDLIPFAGFFSTIRGWFRRADYVESLPSNDLRKDPYGADSSQRKWSGPIQPAASGKKHRPRIAGGGENLPLEILRCLSEWFSVLEDRNTVPGTSLGSMIGLIASMEDTLSALETILTTPLPFVYSVHIRHTVWLYLFFLPFQLVSTFGWHTVSGVCIAAFIYLGFLAAGEEIEQPFGYDENDLDLDMFCREIIHVDIENLKKSPCLNAYFQPPQSQQPVRQGSLTLTETTAYLTEDPDKDNDSDFELNDRIEGLGSSTRNSIASLA